MNTSQYPTASIKEIAHEIYMNCFRSADEMNYVEQTQDITLRIATWLEKQADILSPAKVNDNTWTEAKVLALLEYIREAYWRSSFDRWAYGSPPEEEFATDVEIIEQFKLFTSKQTK